MLVAAALMIATGAAGAAEEGANVVRQYPPYPDVWGRALPFPDDGRYDDRESGAGRAYFVMSAYKGPKGRIVFRILSGSESRPRVYGRHVFNFFTGEFRTLLETSDYKVAQKFQWPHSGAAIRYHKIETLVGEAGVVGWRMPDGNWLHGFSISRFNCRHEWDYEYFAIRRGNDKDGYENLVEKILIALFPKPVQRRVPRRCSTGKEKEDAFYSAKWRQLRGVFSQLADGTLLFSNDNSPIVIRFRRDLTSPYIEANPNLFLIDRTAYLKALDRAAERRGPLSQNVDDAVHEYLVNLNKETNR